MLLATTYIFNSAMTSAMSRQSHSHSSCSQVWSTQAITKRKKPTGRTRLYQGTLNIAATLYTACAHPRARIHNACAHLRARIHTKDSYCLRASARNSSPSLCAQMRAVYIFFIPNAGAERHSFYCMFFL